MSTGTIVWCGKFIEDRKSLLLSLLHLRYAYPRHREAISKYKDTTLGGTSHVSLRVHLHHPGVRTKSMRFCFVIDLVVYAFRPIFVSLTVSLGFPSQSKAISQISMCILWPFKLSRGWCVTRCRCCCQSYILKLLLRAGMVRHVNRFQRLWPELYSVAYEPANGVFFVCVFYAPNSIGLPILHP